MVTTWGWGCDWHVVCGAQAAVTKVLQCPGRPATKDCPVADAGTIEAERRVVGFHHVFDWLGVLTHGAGMKSFTGLLLHPQTHR